jgi:hypothetical protein
MGRYAIIENGTVANVAAADADFAAEQGWVASETADIGDIWDGESFSKPAPPASTPEDVNAERDRRLVADFTFRGRKFQRDPRSLQRITGAATLAGFALGAGAQPGNLRWANPERDFAWIASDNSLMPMDAQTCFEFGQAAANVETSIIFAAKQLREMQSIPTDYTDDKWWP